MKKILLVLLLFSGFSTLCAEPCVSTPAALNSAREKFALADAALNAAWKPLKAKLSATQFAATLKEQRLWLAYRDETAAASAAGEPFVEVETMTQCAEFALSRAEITVSRTAVLQALVLPPVSDWSGVYNDSFGGQITIDARSDGLHFLIDVVRSTAYHTGRIVGVAKSKGQIATYRTTTEDFSSEAEDATKPVLVSMTRDGSRLDVVTENTENFGGMRAYFAGMYVRLRALDTADAQGLESALSERE